MLRNNRENHNNRVLVANEKPRLREERSQLSRKPGNPSQNESERVRHEEDWEGDDKTTRGTDRGEESGG